MAWVRTAGKQLGSKHIQSELRHPATARTDVAAQWERAYILRIFTRRKFNSSLMHNWLAWSLKGEEICLLSGLG